MKATAIALLGLVAVVAAAVLVAPAVSSDGPLAPELREVRAAVARYHSFAQAQADGYTVANEPCISSPAGTMGIHATNAALMADDRIDASRPEILLYVPKANGKLELVGIEYWKRDADQNIDTAGDRPSLFGRAFEGPMEGHGPPGAMPRHYDLHVWVAEANPSGLYALFNPTLSC